MANEWSFPFSSLNGDRQYTDNDFVRFYSQLFSNGIVMTVGSGLQIKQSTAGGMRVNFGDGAMIINGRQYAHWAAEDIAVPVASSTQDRTDSIVIQLDLSKRTLVYVYKSNDVSVVRTDTVYEMQLAKIAVAKNVTQITNSNIQDMRANTTVCGYSSPYQKVDVGNLMTQYESQIIAWFNTMKAQLSSDAAINLQNQINTINSWVATKVYNSGDYNNLVDIGTYLTTTPASVLNVPWSTGEFFVEVQGGKVGSNEYVKQVAYPTDVTKPVAYRTKKGTIWSAWRGYI
ncbi:hypothetical protein COC69_05705 [Bacillus cereus]|uniref:Uncharacterized protein n=1 Tax=Bacillus cereus TaxID=1396 RepID=A0A9X7GXA8_BACCE|nr:hypothetical protein [Bacillus cereus]PGS81625.1 hypothetical protein COC69_05705 [Bacillus cereus]